MPPLPLHLLRLWHNGGQWLPACRQLAWLRTHALPALWFVCLQNGALTWEQPREQSRDQPREQSREQSREQPKTTSLYHGRAVARQR